jgi:two-component system KDP operon response regulator KdpE
MDGAVHPYCWLGNDFEVPMLITWIAAEMDSHWIRTFRAARWEVRSFTPIDFLSFRPLREGDTDIMIVEAMDRHSLEFCEAICQEKIAPVLAFVRELAFAQALLEAGADDFLLAPAEPIEALLRARKLAQSASVIRVGGLKVDLLAWDVSHCGRRVRLSTVEFRLLAALAKRVGQMVDRATILEEVWKLQAGDKAFGQVSSYVGRVRRKIEPDLHNPQYIISVPGTGYRLRNQRQWEARQREAGKAKVML